MGVGANRRGAMKNKCPVVRDKCHEMLTQCFPDENGSARDKAGKIECIFHQVLLRSNDVRKRRWGFRTDERSSRFAGRRLLHRSGFSLLHRRHVLLNGVLLDQWSTRKLGYQTRARSSTSFVVGLSPAPHRAALQPRAPKTQDVLVDSKSS